MPILAIGFGPLTQRAVPRCTEVTTQCPVAILWEASAAMAGVAVSGMVAAISIGFGLLIQRAVPRGPGVITQWPYVGVWNSPEAKAGAEAVKDVTSTAEIAAILIYLNMMDSSNE